MNLVVVTSKAPFGNSEPYLMPEMRELIHHFDSITLLPIHTPQARLQPLPGGISVLPWPYVSPEILALSSRAFASSPLRALHVLSQVFGAKGPGKARNAAVILKALALGAWAREHRIDHIHAYWLSTPATVAMIAAAIAGISWSTTAHRQDIYKRNALGPKARSVSFVRTISRRGTNDLIARERKLSDSIVHMPLGTHIPVERPAAHLRSPHGPFRIVCAAALIPRKGHAELLEAVASLRDRGVPVRCTLAGEGPLHAALLRRAQELNIDGIVSFAGFVEQNRLLQQYRSNAYDVLAVCSQADTGDVPAEGVPAALLEAMAHGVPVVTTDCGGIADLVDDDCGWLIPASDAAALADALFDVYERPGVARARAVSAFARVSAIHDVRRQMKTLSRYIAGAGGEVADPARASETREVTYS